MTGIRLRRNGPRQRLLERAERSRAELEQCLHRLDERRQMQQTEPATAREDVVRDETATIPMEIRQL